MLLALTLDLSSQSGSLLSGRVVNPEGAPVPRMVVRLHAAGSATSVEALTDAEGRYTFRNVAPGRYAVEASHDEHRATYLRQWFGHDEPAPMFSGPPRYDIEVTPATDRPGLDITVRRAVSIEGRVMGPFGEPMADVTVTISRADGRQIFARPAQTDDLGAYRLYGLAPGRYRVCADVRERLEDGGDPIPLPMAPSCHPAALKPADAADVSLSTRDVTGVDIAVQRLGGRTISGSVTDASGAPVDGAWISIHPVQFDMNVSASVRSRAGVFSVSGLLPGRYSVVASTGNAPPGFGSDAASRERGSATADVTAVDASGVHVKTALPRVLTGRIVFDGAAPRPAGILKIVLRPTEEARAGIMGTWPAVAARVDGTFELGGVYSVPSVLDVTGLPAGWAVARITLNDAEVTWRNVDYTAPPRARVDVFLTSNVSSPVVRVINERDEPVVNARIVATPKDPAFWRTGLRWIEATTRPDGTVALPSMVPGDYLLAALSLEDAMTLLRDRDRLDELASFATAVRLDRGEPRLSLPLARLPEKK